MSARVLDWACLVRSAAGEIVPGDRALVLVKGRGALAVAIDGLGHGTAAAEAAEVALDSVRAFDGPDDVAAIAEHCHRQLRATRGAALGAAEFDADRGTMRWLGVGNVEGRLLRRTRRVVHSLVPVAGIAGHDMPPLRVCELPIALGDLLLLATDGVSPRFADDLAPAGPCQAIAERILRRHGRAHDDALVLVARYLGGQG